METTYTSSSANGYNADTLGPTSSGPRLPRREVWIDLPPEYPEFRVKVWVNYPRRLNDELTSGEAERITSALCQVVLEHNGWQDADGSPFPQPTTPEFYAAIPDELLLAMIALLTQQVGKLGSSLQTRSGR